MLLYLLTSSVRPAEYEIAMAWQFHGAFVKSLTRNTSCEWANNKFKWCPHINALWLHANVLSYCQWKSSRWQVVTCTYSRAHRASSARWVAKSKERSSHQSQDAPVYSKVYFASFGRMCSHVPIKQYISFDFLVPQILSSAATGTWTCTCAHPTPLSDFSAAPWSGFDALGSYRVFKSSILSGQ